MDEESTGRRRVKRSREEVGRLLADFAGSGLSRKQWCDLNTISVATLGYWLRREREEASRTVSLVPIEVRDAAEPLRPRWHSARMSVLPQARLMWRGAAA